MKKRDNNKYKNIEFNSNTNSVEYEEEETERKGPPFILLFLFTAFSILFVLGFSFSTIKFLQDNETINSLISKITGDKDEDTKDNYVITYSETVGGAGKNGIYLVNQFPTPDSEGKKFTGSNYVYNFSLIIGSKTVGAYYEFTAVPNATNTLNPSYVKLYLQKNGSDVKDSYKNNGKIKVFTDYNESKYKEETEGVVIYSGKITEDDAKRGRIDFVMRMWISEDVRVDEEFNNKTFGVRVNTYASFTKG